MRQHISYPVAFMLHYAMSSLLFYIAPPQMDHSLVESLVREQDKYKQWESRPILKHGGVSIDLSLAIGDNAITPPGAPGQPDRYPKKSKYQFDPTRFKGV